MADLLGDAWNLLSSWYADPRIFLPLVFLYSIAIAVVLPIPIELILLPPLVSGQWNYLLSIMLALAAGKTVGAALLFLLGSQVEDRIRRYSERYRVAGRAVKILERFVARTGNFGLFIILSTPLAPDTIPLYLYSLFNPEGRTLDRNLFVAANFLAALNRVTIFVLLYVAGVNLFRYL